MELIKVFDNVLDNSMCNHIINIYENNPNCQKSGITSGGYNPNTKLTTDISISNLIHIDFWKIIDDILNSTLNKHIHKYFEYTSSLNYLILPLDTLDFHHLGILDPAEANNQLVLHIH